MAVIAIVGEGLMRPRRCARWTMEIPISRSAGTLRAEWPRYKQSRRKARHNQLPAAGPADGCALRGPIPEPLWANTTC